MAREWHEELTHAQQLLLEGRWKRAHHVSQRVSKELIQRVRGGEGAAHFLAQALALQALAEAGMGREREAVWNWSTALQLFPHLRDLDLEPFGEAGELLAGIEVPVPGQKAFGKPGETFAEREARRRQKAGAASGKPPETPVRPPEENTPNVTPPRKIYAPDPVFPQAQRGRADTTVLCLVQVFIDKEGRLHSPRILKAEGEPTFIASTLMTMREWRFEPARFEGKPVRTYYNLLVRFPRKD